MNVWRHNIIRSLIMIKSFSVCKSTCWPSSETFLQHVFIFMHLFTFIFPAFACFACSHLHFLNLSFFCFVVCLLIVLEISFHEDFWFLFYKLKFLDLIAMKIVWFVCVPLEVEEVMLLCAFCCSCCDLTLCSATPTWLQKKTEKKALYWWLMYQGSHWNLGVALRIFSGGTTLNQNRCPKHCRQLSPVNTWGDLLGQVCYGGLWISSKCKWLLLWTK